MSRVFLIPLMWGFSEASFFFIVPDLFLMWLVTQRKDIKILVKALGFAILGALAGGILVYVLAQKVTYEQVIAYLDRVPGINLALIHKVQFQIQEMGAVSFLKGAFSGIPYKIYAALWSAQYGNFWTLMAITVISRGLRFLASMIFATLINHIGFAIVKNWDTIKSKVFVVGWIIFYIIYFIQHPS